MSTLIINKTYADGLLLSESDLDAIKAGAETYFNETKIEGSNLQTEAVTGSIVLDNNAVTNAKISNNTVTTGILEDAVDALTGITSAKMPDDVATTTKLVDSGITTSKIAAGAMTTAKLQDNVIPKQVMPLPYYSTTAVSSGIGSGTRVSVSATGLVVGKPVIILLESITASEGSGYIKAAKISFTRDSSVIATMNATKVVPSISTTVLLLPPSSYMYIDTPIATSHTYAITTTDASADFSGVGLKIMQVV